MMRELPQYRGLNSKRFDTGKKKKGLQVYGESIQKGLHYKKNGLLLPVNVSVRAQNDYEFTHKVDEARAILRFGDSSGNSKKHLFGIEDDDGNWLNVKLDRAGHDMSGVPGNRPTFPHADGITVEHIPTYKGVKTNYKLGSSGINELTVTFKYNQELTPEQRGNTIVFVRDGKIVFIVEAPFAYDALGSVNHTEPVAMVLTEIGGFAAATLTVDSLWLAGALDPIIDPSVTIEDGVAGGVIKDANLGSNAPDENQGGRDFIGVHRYAVGNNINFAAAVDLTGYPGVAVVSANWELDWYRVDASCTVDTYNIIAGDWGEGTGNPSSAAAAGDITWNSRQHSSNLWNTGGCQGSGTDHAVAAESNYSLTGTGSGQLLTLTAATVQGWIDGTNYGTISMSDDIAALKQNRARSSEATSGKIQFNMEYTEPGGGFPFFFDGGHY